MKAQELRIGNLINDGNGNATPIYTLHDRIASFRDDHLGTEVIQNYEKIEPIPLTTEWLKKFGFEHVGEDEHWDNWENRLMEISHNADGWHLSINGFEYTEGKPFLFVHQLQNLYFALTGEELTMQQ